MAQRGLAGGEASVTIGNYRTSVECDRRWYLAEMATASNTAQIAAGAPENGRFEMLTCGAGAHSKQPGRLVGLVRGGAADALSPLSPCGRGEERKRRQRCVIARPFLRSKLVRTGRILRVEDRNISPDVESGERRLP